jgi:hypothetical protein
MDGVLKTITEFNTIHEDFPNEGWLKDIDNAIEAFSVLHTTVEAPVAEKKLP